MRNRVAKVDKGLNFESKHCGRSRGRFRAKEKERERKRECVCERKRAERLGHVLGIHTYININNCIYF